MSKQISAKELAEIVTRLLTDVQGTGELDGFETYQSFMTDIAQVICDHCGGEIHHPADSLDDIWYVGIHGNDSLPDAFGGIWREYDKEGDLFAAADEALNTDMLKGLPVPKQTPAMPSVISPKMDHLDSQETSVKVKYWDAYNVEGTVETHQFDIADQRSTNGQAFITVGALEGNLDDMLSVTMEVNTNPLNGIDHVPCAHVHFDNDSLAVSLFKIGDKILVRPETNVAIQSFFQKVNGFGEQLYWID